MPKTVPKNFAMADDIANLARLAVQPSPEDVRLFVAKLVRKYRQEDPELAERLDLSLRTSPARRPEGSMLRQGAGRDLQVAAAFPQDGDTRLALLRTYNDPPGMGAPLLPDDLIGNVQAIIRERQQRDRLVALGLSPTRSAALIGPPGVGKTLTARWIANQLGKPLWVLDLTAVMSSLLGKTGNNLRSALDYAKTQEAVLLLDEIDAIAKRRSDETDIGELKRLVTVMLQEVDLWPDTGLLLAATNHPELVDPALWRRFDCVLRFEAPTLEAIRAAVQRFLGPDQEAFGPWTGPICTAMTGQSISDVERAMNSLRRGRALSTAPTEELIAALVGQGTAGLSKADRVRLAVQMAESGSTSHSQISQLTGVARDTIRKHAGPRRGTVGGASR